jgi:hypothetical protein
MGSLFDIVETTKAVEELICSRRVVVAHALLSFKDFVIGERHRKLGDRPYSSVRVKSTSRTDEFAMHLFQDLAGNGAAAWGRNEEGVVIDKMLREPYGSCIQ